ncbi:MAG: GlsB/YeaQ/YmgE family stress response membrane protein [Salaquimonas sp.]|jgi:uncharacterized membrane protein YeaQ/YmgE (transglycosylase-associated protein family)|nr:GlsB/YeaQ/YmgE family stress response membrane protein [Salaquimonas sp.]
MLWEMSRNYWIVTFALACSLSYVCGWIADKIMGHAGFGVAGNCMLLVTGCYVGLFAYNQLGYSFNGETQFAILTGFGGATLALVMLSVAKAFTHT